MQAFSGLHQVWYFFIGFLLLGKGLNGKKLKEAGGVRFS